MLRFFLFFICFISYHFSFAICDQAVPNQYILTTKNPDFLIGSLALQKASSLKYIYNHLSDQTMQKTNTSKSRHLTPLEYSTIILNISDTEATKLKSHPDVHSLEQDCYISMVPLDLDQQQNDSNLDLDAISNSDSQNDDLPENSNETTFAIPNDTLYGDQWAYKVTNSLVPSPIPLQATIVAVSDTGFDTTHADLINSLWVNEAEQLGRSNFDNDKNGCRNDIHGCDVTTSNGDIGINNYSPSFLDHGTHVAGIIGAEQNNSRGIYGTANSAKLMLIKGFSSTKGTTSSDLIRSVYYAVDNGAQLINCSWGVKSTPTMAEFLGFEYARKNDVLAIVAAGNDNIFASKTSPAGLSNVLTVGSISSQKEISTFSNYGDAVDIYAPGGERNRSNEFITSTISGGRYQAKRGTSMAAPFITGILSNIKSAYPQATRNELMNLLLISSETKSLRAYFEPSHREDSKIINTGDLYNLAEEYFTSGSSDLNYEPKTIEKPMGNGGYHSSSSESAFNAKTSGCTSNYSSISPYQSSRMPVAIVLILIPFVATMIFRFRYKKRHS